jgi:hypothetical protein
MEVVRQVFREHCGSGETTAEANLLNPDNYGKLVVSLDEIMCWVSTIPCASNVMCCLRRKVRLSNLYDAQGIVESLDTDKVLKMTKLKPLL